MSVQTLANVQTLRPSFDGLNRHGKLRYSWAVDLGPFKIARQYVPAGEGGAVGNGVARSLGTEPG